MNHNIVFAAIVLLSADLLAQDLPAAPTPLRREWTVEGTTRVGLIAAPAKAKDTPTPAVFVFHGHGGTMRHSANTFRMHEHWPQAISVYLQGLNTPGRLSDPEGKRPGWQHGAGDHNDRDLKFFDAVLASLKAEYQVDSRRVYAMGHSNGGAFTYLLWATRPNVLAAVAPSSAAAARTLGELKPKPVLHVAGEQDPLVKFSWQQATIDRLRRINGCEATGAQKEKYCTHYASETKTPVVTYIHPGDHKFAQDSVPVIVKFFQEHTLAEDPR